MNRGTRYALGLLIEEMGEVLQWIGKALRFGLDTPGPDGISARVGMNKEMGDLMAATDYADAIGVSCHGVRDYQRCAKIHKLLDPSQRDNMGRRLAPDASLRAGHVYDLNQEEESQ